MSTQRSIRAPRFDTSIAIVETSAWPVLDVTVYENPSVPWKPGSGVYVHTPSVSSSVPFAGVVTSEITATPSWDSASACSAKAIGAPT